MDIVLMIDISGSMNGHKIAAVSDALENLKEAMVEYSHTKEPINIAVELFSREVRWHNDKLLPIEQFFWEEPLCTGMTSMGAACISLADFIKKNTWSGTIKCLVMSDGCPTDDYEEGLRSLTDLEIFKNSERYAIALGDEADVYALMQFTGEADNVFKVTGLDYLLDCLLSSTIISVNPSSNKSSKVTEAPNSSDWEDDEWA